MRSPNLIKETIMKNHNASLPVALLGIRISIFLVMFVWTLDKFINPAHSTKIYEKFYFITGLENSTLYLLAGMEFIILVGFLIGLYKNFTYGCVLIFHAISTLSSFKQYLAPFEGANLLFFAAWPMLAACVALYLLRDDDVMLTIDHANR